MRLNKLLICFLLICALALPMALGESGEPLVTETPAQNPTEAPTEKPTETPTQAPTEEPTEAPTEEPAQSPTDEPTETPTESPTEQPTDTPSQEPTSEPTQEPEPSVTNEPTIRPEPSMTPEPTITPEPSITPDPVTTPEPTLPPPTEPGTPGELVVITCEGNAKLSDGVWEITLNAPDAGMDFSWTLEETAELFYLFVDTEYLGETPEYRTIIPSQAYMNGRHTLYVGALMDDGSIAWGAVNFRIATGGKPGGRFPGGRPSGGSRPSGSGTAGTPAEEQGFHVTPGKALTSKHSSGTKNTAAYTFSEINDSAEAITALMLESTQTEIMLDNGAAFFASKDAGKLQLTPESNGACWHLNALAMNTLAESDIDRVVFNVGGTAYSIPTRMEFSGSIYASLRAKGYVSKDMEIGVDAQGVHVFVNGRCYSINDNGELVPCEE